MSPEDRPESALPSPGEVDARRRRFLGAGSAATPALLTLASQPALGVTCFTPSRSLSRNTSVSQQGKYGDCVGARPTSDYASYQKKNASPYYWPDLIPPTTPFHPTFFAGPVKFQKQNGDSLTMGEVMLLGTTQSTMASNLIAAYLNVSGAGGAVIPSHVLTPAKVLRIWQEWSTMGYFEPIAGVQWNAVDITAYLKSNGIIG